MIKKRPYTFLFRRGADQAVGSPAVTPVAKSGKTAKGVKKGGGTSPGLKGMAGSAGAKPAAVAAAKRAGVLDIDVYAGFLFRALTVINKSQKLVEFHQIEAATPVGLTRSGARLRAIAQKWGIAGDDPDLAHNAYAPDIYAFAGPISELRGIDLLICLIAPMITDELTEEADGKTGLGLNLFTTNDAKTIIVSAYGMREYAEKAGRPFETGLAILIAGQLICNYTRLVDPDDDLDYHKETRGCVLDYCGDRADLMKVLGKPALCGECRARIHPDARKDVLSMIKAIAEYRR